MINSTNKTIAFFLSAFLAVVSWAIIIIYLAFKVATLFRFGVMDLNFPGFLLTTILVSIYTVVILFKISTFSYFPLILLLLHMASLNGSTLAIMFIIVDLVMLLLLNTGAVSKPASQTRYYYSNSQNQQSGPFQSNNQESKPKQTVVDDDNVFDAEYHTKD